jgi:hypothetical protein
MCQKVRLGQSNMTAALKTTAVNQPFQHIMWDTIGPLPKDALGYEYIVVIIDRFTRFIEMVPTPTVNARDAAVALLQICGRYGTFSTVHSDRGKQFDSAVVAQLCLLLGITQQFGPPYRPEAQGTVERSNRETMRHLRAMIPTAPDHATWSDLLPMVQRIYNAKVNRNTGVAPAKMLFGGAVDLDRQLLLQPPAEGPIQTYDAYVQALLTAQQQIVEASTEFQRVAVEKALKDAPETPTVLDVGQLVLIQPAARQRRAKLQPRWLGPYVIIARDSDTYQCQDLNTAHVKTVHITRLKVYKEDPRYASADVALWDSEVALVDSIVGHRHGATRAKYLFKIRWQDYGPESDSWLPFKDIKHTTAFAHYIRQVMLPLFPPDKFPLPDDYVP